MDKIDKKLPSIKELNLECDKLLNNKIYLINKIQPKSLKKLNKQFNKLSNEINYNLLNINVI